MHQRKRNCSEGSRALLSVRVIRRGDFRTRMSLPGMLLTMCILSQSILIAETVESSTEQPNIQSLAMLRVGTVDALKTLNLLGTSTWEDPNAVAILARIYDTAIQRNASDGTTVPRLAVGIDINGNGRLDSDETGAFDNPPGMTNVTVFYDFSNVTFHDGRPMTIMDVLFSYHVFALDQRLNGPLHVLMDLGGSSGSNFSSSRWLWVLPVDDKDGDPATAGLRFTLQFSYANFAWATLGIPVLPRHIWEGSGSGRHGDFGLAIYPDADVHVGRGVPIWDATYPSYDYALAQGWQPAIADVIGSGHFFLSSMNTITQETELGVNVDYAFGPPKYNGIRFIPYATTATAISALRSKAVDFLLTNIPPDAISDLRQAPNIVLVEARDMYPITAYFSMRKLPWGYSTYPPPDRTSDVGLIIRTAVAHIADRRWMAVNLTRGNSMVADGMISPANNGWFNASVPTYAYDPVKAIALLDSPEAQAAGISADPPGPCNESNPSGCRILPQVGNGGFDIKGPTQDYDEAMANVTVRLAKEMQSIGLNAVARPVGLGYLVNAFWSHGFDMAVMPRPNVLTIDPWTLARGDPEFLGSFFQSSTADAGHNAGGFYDSIFDSAAEAAQKAGDFATRCHYIQYSQAILAERLPAIPLLFSNLTWAFRSDTFTGWALTGSTVFNYWSLQNLMAAANPGPTIALLSPPDGSIFKPGIPIRLQVQDTDLVEFQVTIDSSLSLHPSPPYEIDTITWSDGLHTLEAIARDSADNMSTKIYHFTVDSEPPGIALASPANNSLVPAGTIAIFDIQDDHLATVNISVDGAEPSLFAPPYNLALSILTDGSHAFTIAALDLASNQAIRWFALYTDSTLPQVVEWSPVGDHAPQESSIHIRFSESVNRTSAESAFLLTDGASVWGLGNGAFSWDEDNVTFDFIPNANLIQGRTYSVEVQGTLTDAAGNSMVQDFSWSFTVRKQDSVSIWWLLAISLAACFAIILLLIWRGHKQRKDREREVGKHR